MQFAIRSLSSQESRVVLALAEQGRRDVTRAEIIDLLGATPKAADHVIEGLRRKGWLERCTWGKYLFVPPEQGPDALGDSNLLARASRIAEPYYIGFGTAAAFYGQTTQHRSVIYLVTPVRLRDRTTGDTRVQIVNQSPRKFFGYEPVNALGDTVMMSDREKTALDCVDRPELSGGIGEALFILATASRKLDWNKLADYVERIGAGPLARRLGWMLDHVKADVPPPIRTRLLTVAGRSRKTWLGSNPARTHVENPIGFDDTWQVFVNVAPEELRDSAGLGARRIQSGET